MIASPTFSDFVVSLRKTSTGVDDAARDLASITYHSAQQAIATLFQALPTTVRPDLKVLFLKTRRKTRGYRRSSQARLSRPPEFSNDRLAKVLLFHVSRRQSPTFPPSDDRLAKVLLFHVSRRQSPTFPPSDDRLVFSLEFPSDDETI